MVQRERSSQPPQWIPRCLENNDFEHNSAMCYRDKNHRDPWLLRAARFTPAPAGRGGSWSQAGGRGGAPGGGGWPWRSRAGTPGSAAPDGPGAAPCAGGAWPAGAPAGAVAGGSHGGGQPLGQRGAYAMAAAAADPRAGRPRRARLLQRPSRPRPPARPAAWRRAAPLRMALEWPTGALVRVRGRHCAGRETAPARAWRELEVSVWCPLSACATRLEAPSGSGAQGRERRAALSAVALSPRGVQGGGPARRRARPPRQSTRRSPACQRGQRHGQGSWPGCQLRLCRVASHG